jgi:hypothetical protein
MALRRLFVSWLLRMILSTRNSNCLEVRFLQIKNAVSTNINLAVISYISILELLATSGQ